MPTCETAQPLTSLDDNRASSSKNEGKGSNHFGNAFFQGHETEHLLRFLGTQLERCAEFSKLIRNL
jgi:hypothetical protein